MEKDPGRSGMQIQDGWMEWPVWHSQCLRPKFLNLNHNPSESLKLSLSLCLTHTHPHTLRICRCFCQSWCLRESKCTVASKCIYPRMCECARVQHGCRAPERPYHSAAARSDQQTRRQSEPTGRRSGRHHYAAQRAVCPDPAGVRSSPLILMSSPGFRFTGVQRPRVGWRGGGGGVEGNINLPTQTFAQQLRGRHNISSGQTQIFPSRGNSQRSARQSWQQVRLWDNLQDPTCTASRLSPGVAVT